MITRVSLKVLFPHLYILQVWQSWMRLQKLQKGNINFLLCASVVLSILSLPQKITPEARFSKPSHRYLLFSKRIMKFCTFFIERGA